MILSSIYMALHTFKVLCKHSLINLCFRDPVQQPLPQGTKSGAVLAGACQPPGAAHGDGNSSHRGGSAPHFWDVPAFPTPGER